MRPTVIEGDYFAADMRCHSGQVGDVVVFSAPDDRRIDLIKRIVGVAGDHLEIKGGHLWRNGQEVRERYVHEPIDGDYEHTVGPDSVFVMGDNRNNSSDSRVFGDVPLQNLRGRVLFIFWPFEHIRDL